MIVRCTRDNTKFEAIIVPYKAPEGLLHYIECPTCARRYFKNKSDGEYAIGDEAGVFQADRDLVIVKE